MSYSCEIEVEQYLVFFDYSYDHKTQSLLIDSWIAYDENNREVMIPDVSQSELIQKGVQKYLDEDYQENSADYEADYIDSLQEQSFDRYRDFLNGD